MNIGMIETFRKLGKINENIYCFRFQNLFYDTASNRFKSGAYT